MKLALNSRVIEARGGYVMQKFDDHKEIDHKVENTVNNRLNDASIIYKANDPLIMDTIYDISDNQQIIDFLNHEEYDSESVMMDLEHQEQSNLTLIRDDKISKIITKISNKHYMNKMESVFEELYAKYDKGKMMRYDVMEPTYESFAEECITNNTYTISATTFNKYLRKSQTIYGNITINSMIANKTSRKFGIQQYQPIDIRHIMAIIIYTDETGYSHALNRSFWTTNKQTLGCQDFYWFGRYLFEAIEYFGDLFHENFEHKIHQGATKAFSFGSFAPSVNYPRSTTSSMKIALQFSTNTGCVLELIPKYTGILNNSKFIDVSKMSKYENEQER